MTYIIIATVIALLLLFWKTYKKEKGKRHTNLDIEDIENSYDASVLVSDNGSPKYLHMFDIEDHFNGLTNYGVYISECKRINVQLSLRFKKCKSTVLNLDKKMFNNNGYPIKDLDIILQMIQKFKKEKSKKMSCCYDIENKTFLKMEDSDDNMKRLHNSMMSEINELSGTKKSKEVNVYFRDIFKEWFDYPNQEDCELEQRKYESAGIFIGDDIELLIDNKKHTALIQSINHGEVIIVFEEFTVIDGESKRVFCLSIDRLNSLIIKKD